MQIFIERPDGGRSPSTWPRADRVLPNVGRVRPHPQMWPVSNVRGFCCMHMHMIVSNGWSFAHPGNLRRKFGGVRCAHDRRGGQLQNPHGRRAHVSNDENLGAVRGEAEAAESAPAATALADTRASVKSWHNRAHRTRRDNPASVHLSPPHSRLSLPLHALSSPTFPHLFDSMCAAVPWLQWWSSRLICCGSLRSAVFLALDDYRQNGRDPTDACSHVPQPWFW